MEPAGSEPYSLHNLFGGAIQAAFPNRFQDVSVIREVPDNQEVFADPSRDESIIVELLDLKADVADLESARWFFEDLGVEQDAGPGSALESIAALAPTDVPNLDPAIPKAVAIGTMAIAKARQGPEARNIVRCYLANLRLHNVNTDVVITVYEPLHISQHSESAAVVGAGAAVPAAAAACMPAGDVFRLILTTFRINDWSLFGSS